MPCLGLLSLMKVGAQCEISSLRAWLWCSKDTMMFMDCFLVIALLLCIEGGKGEVPGLKNMYTNDFLQLMISLQSTEVGPKILREVNRANDFTLYGYDLGKCPQRLRHIISDKMNCRRVADKLEPRLLSVQIFYSMTANDKLFESIMVRKNCSQLSGESFAMCCEALSGRIQEYHSFSSKRNMYQELKSCYIEEKESQSNYLTER